MVENQSREIIRINQNQQTQGYKNKDGFIYLPANLPEYFVAHGKGSSSTTPRQISVYITPKIEIPVILVGVSIYIDMTFDPVPSSATDYMTDNTFNVCFEGLNRCIPIPIVSYEQNNIAVKVDACNYNINYPLEQVYDLKIKPNGNEKDSIDTFEDNEINMWFKKIGFAGESSITG